MPKGKKTGQMSSHDPLHADPLDTPSAREREGRGGSMGVADAREHESAYTGNDGRHFRVLYNPDVHEPRWFVRSFMVGPDREGDVSRRLFERCAVLHRECIARRYCTQHDLPAGGKSHP